MLDRAVIVTQKNEIKEILKEAMSELEKEREAKTPDKLYTVNQVAKRLGRAHETISKLVKKGMIKTTKDGLIPESAINEYLGQ
jgi:excisionase family DNA binding protein